MALNKTLPISITCTHPMTNKKHIDNLNRPCRACGSHTILGDKCNIYPEIKHKCHRLAFWPSNHISHILLYLLSTHIRHT